MGLRQVELFFIALAIFQSSVAQGQSPLVFVYGEDRSWDFYENVYPEDWVGSGWLDSPYLLSLTSGAFTCLGDFDQTISMSKGQISVSSDVSGSCFYNQPTQLIQPCPNNTVNSFGTIFQVRMLRSRQYCGGRIISAQNKKVSDTGLAFIMFTNASTRGWGVDYPGSLNSTANAQASDGHYFAVKFYLPDEDPYNLHIGVDHNASSLKNTSTADWLPHVNFTDALQGDRSALFNVWIQYNISTEILEVFLGETKFQKPTRPIISTKISLIDTFSSFSACDQSGVYVGFSGYASLYDWNQRPSELFDNFRVNQWTFNSDGLAPDSVRNPDGTEVDVQGILQRLAYQNQRLAYQAEQRAEQMRLRRQKTIKIVAATIPSLLVPLILVYIFCLVYWRYARLTAIAKKYEIENGVLDRGGLNFKYKALSAATKGFSSSQLLGSGGFGSVYKGKLLLKGDEKPTEVAVKRISATSSQGAQEFLAEVKIIGQAQHRNLVRLLGWCHEKGELLLVYDYMPNGSVDQHLFKNTDDAPGEAILTWSRRLKIVSGLAAALTYLHEEWEKLVIHRDVKCSNVMLDRDFNARLGDFGLARLYEHDKAPASTAILAGTHGYMAPELFHTLKATEKTDVYSFGAVVLEVATGKKPILCVKDRGTSDHVLLVDWVWELYENDALLDAADSRLENAYDRGEMAMFLKIGLLCSHPDPNERPCMREVVNIWKGLIPFPPVPRSKPIPTYALAMNAQAGLNSSFLDSVSYSAITVHSFDDRGPTTAQKPKEQSGDPNPSLRYRPHNTASLPF